MGTGLPVATDGTVDGARVALLDRLVVDPQAPDHAGPKALDHDVGCFDQAE